MNIYAQRRESLMNKYSEDTIVCIFSGNEVPRSQDDCYPFSVDRNFYYLTGIDREGMILTLFKSQGKVVSKLFIQPYDEVLARWVGGRMKEEEVKEISAVEMVEDVQNFYGWVNNQYNAHRKNHGFTFGLDLWMYTEHQTDTCASSFAKVVKDRFPAVSIMDVYPELTALRQEKDSYEVDCLRKATEITRKGIEAMMKASHPGITETELAAIFDLELAKNGCTENSFGTIAASGMNATVLHYHENNCICKDGDLFLCDLGAAYNHYCADVSRTFPINGKFTDRQKEIYTVVLKGQELVQKSCKPGVTTTDLNTILVNYYKEELPKIGLTKPVNEYYFHGVSHLIGLDTHDVTLAHGMTPLRPGFILSNEPGLYISDEGIGIRIEDDLLVTEDGCIDLSDSILKTVEDIENFMKK